MRQLFAFLLLLFPMSGHSEVSIENRQGSILGAEQFQLKDEQGNAVQLSRYFKDDRPLLLAFVYYECPGACTTLLNGMIESLSPHILLPGRDFELVVISINPRDSAELATQKKNTYLKRYGRMDTVEGWHFLTASENTISGLTQRLGFHFEYDPKSDQYNHPSALFIFTPDQVLSSVLTGFSFPSVLVRTSLVQAREKKLGTFLDRINAMCYTFLPHVGLIDRPSRWLELILVLALIAGVLFQVLKKRGRERRA